jgi:hypothetical protein
MVLLLKATVVFILSGKFPVTRFWSGSRRDGPPAKAMPCVLFL